jgi:hypothetical protein
MGTSEKKTDELVQRSVALSPELWASVEAYAERISAVKIGYSAAIRHALAAYFDQLGIKPKANAPQLAQEPAKGQGSGERRGKGRGSKR